MSESITKEKETETKIIFITGAGGSGKSFLTKQASDNDYLKIDFDREAEDLNNFNDLAKFIFETITGLGIIKNLIDFNEFNKKYSEILTKNENKADKAVMEFLELNKIYAINVYDSVMVPAYKKLFSKKIKEKMDLSNNKNKTIIVDVGGRKLSCLGKDFEKELSKLGINGSQYIVLDPGAEIITENISSDEIELDDQGVQVVAFAKRRAFAKNVLNELENGELEIFELNKNMLTPLSKELRDGGKEISCDILSRVVEELKHKEEIYNNFKKYIKSKVKAEVGKSYKDFIVRLQKLKDDGIKFTELKSRIRKENVDNFCHIIKSHNSSNSLVSII